MTCFSLFPLDSEGREDLTANISPALFYIVYFVPDYATAFVPGKDEEEGARLKTREAKM